jgi:hypothetical protein
MVPPLQITVEGVWAFNDEKIKYKLKMLKCLIFNLLKIFFILVSTRNKVIKTD